MNKFGFILFLLFVSLAFAVFGYPTSDQIQNTPGATHVWDASAAKWRPVAGNSEGGNMMVIQPIAVIATQSMTLVSGVAQSVTTGLSGTRQFVEVKAHDETDEFWVDFGATAVAGQCRPCKGYVYLAIPTDIVLSVVASSAVDLSIVEGGFE
jgi:hypothetical protein